MTPFAFGVPLKEYHCKFSVLDLGRGFLCFVSICACVWAIFTQPASLDKITGSLTLLYFIMYKLVALAFCLFALVYLWLSIRRFLARHERILVYNEGFVYCKKNGFCAIPWREIAAMRKTKKSWPMVGSSPLELFMIDIQLSDGSALRLNNTFRDIESFWQTMEQAVMAFRTTHFQREHHD